MSARHLPPAAAELAEPVASAVPPTTREGLYARVALVYLRGRQQLAPLRRR